MDKLQWGIIGTGGIAAAFAEGVRHSRFGQLRAAGSRSLKTANSFADQFDIPSRHGSYEDLVNDPFFDQSGAFVQVDHPQAGSLKQPWRPFIMGECPWALERPAPLLGQHNQEVLNSLGYTNEDIVCLRQMGVI